MDEQQVEFVLAGSLVLALNGACIASNDVDIVPRLTTENLERVAAALDDLRAVPAYVAEWEKGPSLYECERWRPHPPSEQHLDHLFVTRYGLLDVVPHLAGEHEELYLNAVAMDVDGYAVKTCAPIEVLRRIETARRAKDADRLLAYRSALESL